MTTLFTVSFAQEHLSWVSVVSFNTSSRGLIGGRYIWHQHFIGLFIYVWTQKGVGFK